MKNFIYSLVALTLFVSCQIEDDNAPAPDEAFTKFYGELTSYEASDIEIIYDQTGEIVEGFLVFGTVLNANGDHDFYVMRTDPQGNLIDTASFGWGNEFGNIDWDGDTVEDDLVGDESAGQIEIVGDFYFLIGTTTIDETALGISNYKVLTFAVLNSALELEGDSVFAVFAEFGNTELDLIGNDIIFLSDNSFLLVGSEEVDRDGPGNGPTDFDNYFLKIDANDNGFEETQGVAGAGEDEQVVRVFEKNNGNIVAIGYANTPSALGENNGNNGVNAYFLELDPNGTVPVNSAYYGVESPDQNNTAIYDEIVSSAISTPSGYVLAGTSRTSDDNEFGFVMSLSQNGEFLSGNTLPSSRFSNIQTRVNGVTQSNDNDFILVGQYPNFSAVINNQQVTKSGEGLFMKVDQASIPVEGYESNFGLTDGSDEIVDAVTLPDGKIVAVANVDFGGGVKLISIMKLNDTGNLED